MEPPPSSRGAAGGGNAIDQLAGLQRSNGRIAKGTRRKGKATLAPPRRPLPRRNLGPPTDAPTSPVSDRARVLFGRARQPADPALAACGSVRLGSLPDPTWEPADSRSLPPRSGSGACGPRLAALDPKRSLRTRPHCLPIGNGSLRTRPPLPPDRKRSCGPDFTALPIRNGACGLDLTRLPIRNGSADLTPRLPIRNGSLRTRPHCLPIETELVTRLTASRFETGACGTRPHCLPIRAQDPTSLLPDPKRSLRTRPRCLSNT